MCWRLVEAQHRVSTLKLVDTLDEQALIEDLLETTKPNLPPECVGLHYLLSTPFRYGAPYPKGSRFRRAGFTPGIFYASEHVETAVAELAFHRLLFFAESPATPWLNDAAEFTAFSVSFRTELGLDLTEPPLASERAAWTDPLSYDATQALADIARDASIQALRSESVRDPKARANITLLTCLAFDARKPSGWQTWRMRLGPHGAQALCAHPERRLEFAPDVFANDPRMAAMSWNRRRD